MNEPLLISIPGLLELEEQNLWEEACTLLLKKWKRCPDDYNLLIRLGTECWHVLVDWDVDMPKKQLDYTLFKHNLLRCTAYGLARVSDSFQFLWSFGYMVSLMPLLFCGNDGSDKEYLGWEEVGHELLRKGFKLYPDHPLSNLLFLAYDNPYEIYQKQKAEVSSYVRDFFVGKTAMEQYFIDVFTGELS